MDVADRVRGYASDAVDDCAASSITAVSRFEAGDRHAVYRVTYRGGEGRDFGSRRPDRDRRRPR
jgi:hypothetical protein